MSEIRTRSTFSGRISDSIEHWYSDGVPQFVGVNYLDLEGETMTDVITGTPPPWAFKPCTHMKWETKRLCGSFTNCTWCNAEESHVINRDILMWNTFGTYDDASPSLIDWDVIANHTPSMFSNCLNLVDAPTDLIVFLVELRDIGSMFAFLFGKLKLIAQALRLDLGFMLSKFNAVIESVGDGVHLILDESSEDLLSWSYVVRPTVNEILGLTNTFLRLMKRHEELKEGAGKLQKTRTTRTIKVADAVEALEIELGSGACASTDPSGCDVSDKHYRWRRKYLAYMDTEVTVTVAYKYSLPPDWDAFIGKANYIFSRLGVRPSLGTVWNLIPFSFVVDYFLPVGNMLETVGFDPAAITIDVVDVCVSARSGSTSDLEWMWACETGIDTYKSLVRMTRSDYERRVGKDVQRNLLPHFRMPSGFQWLLTAALAYSSGRG